MLLRLETSSRDTICFAIFSVGASPQGALRVELGSIQGSPRSLAAITKIATRDFNSTRPKHLLMTILCHFAWACHIDSIVCVSTRAQLSYREASNTFLADYDSLWEELGGERQRSGFFSLPLPFARQAAAKGATTHRTRQRRRAKLKAEIFGLLEQNLAGRPS